MTLRANTLLFSLFVVCYLHTSTLLPVSPRNSFSFIFVLISLSHIDLIMTLSERRNVVVFLNFKAGTHERAYSRSTLLQHASRSKTPSSAPTISSEKNMLRNKTFAPEFCSLRSIWFDMREQAPGANLLHESVSGASSLVCTEICFAGACFRSKLPRVYLLGYLPGSPFRERV